MDKSKSLILASAVVLIAILSVALLSMQNNVPTSEEEDIIIPENEEETNGFPYGAPPANFTVPEGNLNFTFPEGGFNFTSPRDGFNGTFPEGGFNSTFPDGGFRDASPPFMGNLTDEQRTIFNEKMQELRESGATQEEIMAAMQELMEEFGTQNP